MSASRRISLYDHNGPARSMKVPHGSSRSLSWLKCAPTRACPPRPRVQRMIDARKAVLLSRFPVAAADLPRADATGKLVSASVAAAGSAPTALRLCVAAADRLHLLCFEAEAELGLFRAKLANRAFSTLAGK